MVRGERYTGINDRALPATAWFSDAALEGIKMLGSLMVTILRSKRDKPWKMQFSHTPRAYFYGTAQRGIYVNLPEEQRTLWSSGEINVWNSGRVGDVEDCTQVSEKCNVHERNGESGTVVQRF